MPRRRTALLPTLALLCPLIALAPLSAGAQVANELTKRLAEAQQSPAVADALQKTGRKVAGAVCANCHGEGGNSVQGDVPNLAGQNRAYLLEQIRLFSEGKRRYAFMEGMMRALSTDEKVGLVLFFSAQPVHEKPVADGALVEKGKQYFQKVCITCHGQNGRGSDQIARIAGQQLPYLRASLKHYREGSGGRVNPLMANMAKSLTDDDIQAVTAYVSSMK